MSIQKESIRVKRRKAKIIAIILNHPPLPEQIKQLQEMGYQRHICFSHPEIEPDCPMQMVYLFVKHSFINTICSRVSLEIPGKRLPDAFWVQGDYRFFKAFCGLAESLKIPLFIATTKRESKEMKLANGSIKKISIFKHVKFIRIV